MERLLLPTYESAGVSAETHEKYYAGPVASRIIDNKAISDNDVFRKAGDAMGTKAISGASMAALGGVTTHVVSKTDLTKGEKLLLSICVYCEYVLHFKYLFLQVIYVVSSECNEDHTVMAINCYCRYHQGDRSYAWLYGLHSGNYKQSEVQYHRRWS